LNPVSVRRPDTRIRSTFGSRSPVLTPLTGTITCRIALVNWFDGRSRQGWMETEVTVTPGIQARSLALVAFGLDLRPHRCLSNRAWILGSDRPQARSTRVETTTGSPPECSHASWMPVPRTGEPVAELEHPERTYADKDAGVRVHHDGRHAWLRVGPEKVTSRDFQKFPG